jgi:ribosome-binding factor A
MVRDKRGRKKPRANRSNMFEDEEVDPQMFFGGDRRQIKELRKAKQLCRQVEETLILVLPSQHADGDLFTNLSVMSVVPAPDSSRLLVTVSADLPWEQFDRARIEEQLSAVNGRLRSEVAAAITRRKAPMLAFCVVGPQQEAQS